MAQEKIGKKRKQARKIKYGEKKKVWQKGADHQLYKFRQCQHRAWHRMVILTMLEQQPMCRADVCKQLVTITGYDIVVEQLQKTMVGMLEDSLIEVDRTEPTICGKASSFFKPTAEGLRQRDIMWQSFKDFVDMMNEIA